MRLSLCASVRVCVCAQCVPVCVSVSFVVDCVYPFVLLVSHDGQFFCLCFELTHAAAATLIERARSVSRQTYLERQIKRLEYIRIQLEKLLVTSVKAMLLIVKLPNPLCSTKKRELKLVGLR